MNFVELDPHQRRLLEGLQAFEQRMIASQEETMARLLNESTSAPLRDICVGTINTLRDLRKTLHVGYAQIRRSDPLTFVYRSEEEPDDVFAAASLD